MYNKRPSAKSPINLGIPLLIVLFFIFGTAFSQPTILRGKVIDLETGQPIPYISVVFNNTPNGSTIFVMWVRK